MQSIAKLPNLVIKPTSHTFLWFLKCYNSWAAAIRNSSSPHKALHIYSHMHRRSIPFDTYSILFTLKSSTQLHNYPTIQHLHSHITKLGFGSHVYVATSLLHAYAVVSFVDACQLFDEMPEKNTVTWTRIISGYWRTGNVERAKELFDEMPEKNIVTWNAMISGYWRAGNVERAKELFDEMPEKNIVTWNAMISRYSSNGNVERAKELFDEMPEKNIVTWTAMISGYWRAGNVERAKALFDEMPEKDIVTWNAMISGYSSYGNVGRAKELFDEMPEKDIVTWNAMISGYSSNGNVERAKELFDEMPEKNIVTWNAMISGYWRAGNVERAKALFDEMPEKNIVTWNAMISGYSSNGNVERAKALFDEMPEKNIVTWNAMISGYSSNGNVEKTRLVSEEMPVRNASSWSAMISGYVNNGKHELGLSLFRDMVVGEEGVRRNHVAAVVSVLSGCANLSSVGLLVGKSVHAFMIKSWWEMNAEIGTVLISMYAKCGYLKGAEQVFELVQEKGVMAWTALICGSAQHGYSEEALRLFETMQNVGVRPDEMTFTGVLSACVNTGLVEQGRKYFNLIEESGLEVQVQHYGCMVDLYGKAGLLEEAYDVIKNMRLEPDIAVWGAFLSACKEHKQFEMAKRVIEEVMKMLKPEDGGVYTLIAGLYRLGGKWDDAERVKSLMVNNKVRKPRGSSFVQIDGREN